MTSDAQGPDLAGLLSQIGQMQQNLQAAQEGIASEEVRGSAGGGAVTVTLTGAYEFRAVHIDPSVIDASDPAMLEDLVLAALRDAAEAVQALHSRALGGLTGLPGLGGTGFPGSPGA